MHTITRDNIERIAGSVNLAASRFYAASERVRDDGITLHDDETLRAFILAFDEVGSALNEHRSAIEMIKQLERANNE